jgi:hypothetical protein
VNFVEGEDLLAVCVKLSVDVGGELRLDVGGASLA